MHNSDIRGYVDITACRTVAWPLVTPMVDTVRLT